MLKSLGCTSRKSADPEITQSNKIDKQLRKEKKKYVSTYRLLLLGKYSVSSSKSKPRLNAPVRDTLVAGLSSFQIRLNYGQRGCIASYLGIYEAPLVALIHKCRGHVETNWTITTPSS